MSHWLGLFTSFDNTLTVVVMIYSKYISDILVTEFNNNSNNNHGDIYSAVIMAEPQREITRFTQ